MHGNWRFINDYGGGQLTDWAGHHIDIAHWGLGFDRTGPISVEGTGRSYPDGIYDAFAEYDFTCVYANGLKMRVANRSKLENAGALWKAKDIGILWKGSDGWVYVSRGQIKASDDKILKEVIGEKEINLYRSTNHHQNFIDCVRSRKETITPAEVGHRSISVGLLGEIAMITGRKIHWDPQTEKFTDNDIPATRLLKRPFRDPWKL
jgi:predicted dehydrogenase